MFSVRPAVIAGMLKYICQCSIGICKHLVRISYSDLVEVALHISQFLRVRLVIAKRRVTALHLLIWSSLHSFSKTYYFRQRHRLGKISHGKQMTVFFFFIKEWEMNEMLASEWKAKCALKWKFAYDVDKYLRCERIQHNQGRVVG